MTDGDNRAISSYSVFEFLKATWSLRGPQTEYYGYSSIVVYIPYVLLAHTAKFWQYLVCSAPVISLCLFCGCSQQELFRVCDSLSETVLLNQGCEVRRNSICFNGCRLITLTSISDVLQAWMPLVKLRVTVPFAL